MLSTALRMNLDGQPPWTAATPVVHPGRGPLCWPCVWNTAADSELLSAAEWVERTSGSRLFHLSRGCATSAIEAVFTEELQLFVRGVAQRVVVAVTARPAGDAAGGDAEAEKPPS